MQSASDALARLCDPEAEVSAHYLISGQGGITQMVPEDQRAWHAGEGEWHGVDDINSRSIGIELDNRGDHPFSEPQMQSLEGLLRGIMAAWDIGPESVIGHSDIAPGRKVDPGPRFDWARLAHLGLAAKSDQSSARPDPNWSDFQALAKNAGYTAEADNETLLSTVRLRHRPWARGPLSEVDLSVLTG